MQPVRGGGITTGSPPSFERVERSREPSGTQTSERERSVSGMAGQPDSLRRIERQRHIGIFGRRWVEAPRRRWKKRHRWRDRERSSRHRVKQDIPAMGWRATTMTATQCLHCGAKRQGGNGRSDAERLPARSKPSKGMSALRERRRPPTSIFGSVTWSPGRET